MIGHLLRNVTRYAVFTTDPNGYIESCNQAAGRLVGYTADEIFGKHLSLFCPEETERQLSKPPAWWHLPCGARPRCKDFYF